MESHVYKVVELVGSSPDSVEDAVSAALKRAGETLRNLRWFEVVQIRGNINKGAVSDYQVVLKVGFTLDREDESMG
ncbi:dodecin [Methylocystis sp.]|jgi:dodecin|uniref:dodecin n=1 Tax=Methylocystis sp. TaxID=1911079 RepID=UPI001EB569BB|nr:dodecin domain-containing protein [Methylocystis sp.]MBI5314287.1 dodecin domain-containing protein [Methylocystis sp.]